MRRKRILIVAACAWCVASSATVAQETTPAAESSPTVLMHLVIDDLPPDRVVHAGIARTIFAPGAGLTQATGLGAAVMWVEDGAVVLTVAASTRSPTVVSGRGPAVPGAPALDPLVGETTLLAGDALVLPSGSTVELRNTGDEPAATLSLLAAPDSHSELGDGATASVIVGSDRALPSATITLTVERRTLAPAERLAVATKPTVTFVAAVVRTQNVKLGVSATAFTNRDTAPMPVYVLTLSAPVADGADTSCR